MARIHRAVPARPAVAKLLAWRIRPASFEFQHEAGLLRELALQFLRQQISAVSQYRPALGAQEKRPKLVRFLDVR